MLILMNIHIAYLLHIRLAAIEREAASSHNQPLVRGSLGKPELPF